MRAKLDQRILYLDIDGSSLMVCPNSKFKIYPGRMSIAIDHQVNEAVIEIHDRSGKRKRVVRTASWRKI